MSGACREAQEEGKLWKVMLLLHIAGELWPAVRSIPARDFPPHGVASCWYAMATSMQTTILCLTSLPTLLQVAGELRASVQRLYVDLLLRVDAALTAICAEFEPARYSKARGRCVWCGVGLPVLQSRCK